MAGPARPPVSCASARSTIPMPAPPDVHVFARSRQKWVQISEDAESYEIFYSGKDVPRIYGEEGAARWRAVMGR